MKRNEYVLINLLINERLNHLNILQSSSRIIIDFSLLEKELKNIASILKDCIEEQK